jgi:glycosyltransferase involved in cell wall biosynthesis
MTTSKSLNKIVLFCAGLTAAGGEERLLLEEEKFFREKGIGTTVLIKAEPSFVSQVIALRRKLKEIKPDIVIASSNGSAMYLYLATMFTSIPYMIHIHGTLFWFIGNTMKYALIHKNVFSEIRESVIGHKEFIPEHPQCSFKRRVKSEISAIRDYLVVRKACKIIVLTDQLKWEVKKLYGRDSVVARGCLPPEALTYQPKQDIRQKLGLQNKRVIFSVGRLDPRKRIDVLIKSFAKILPKYPDIYLLIGGIGEEEEYLKKLTEDLGITERVKFLGFILDSELFDYYASCDVFAFPSWTSSGITPYEALAVGKKVVWTSEADEPVLGEEHVFVAEPNVEDFARGLEEALDTDVEGNVDLSNYTWDKYFETVYGAVVEAVNGLRSK